LDGFHAANAGTDKATDAGQVLLVEFELGISDSHARGATSIMNEPVGAARFLGRHVGIGFEVFDLAADLAVEVLCVEPCDGSDTALAGEKILPKGVQIVPEWGDDADAGNDDAPFTHGEILSA